LEKPLYEEMFRLEGTHWWFVGRRKVLFALLRQYLKKLRPDVSRPSICDIGTGCGLNLAELSREYDVTGMDVSDEAIAFCRQRGGKVIKGRLPDSVPFSAGSFDAVLLLDVLEHVEQDQEALTSASRIIDDGGLVIATVPAYPRLWTKRDDFHGHRRRYTRREFAKVIREAGLRVVLLTYFNTILFLPAAATRLAQRVTRTDRYGPDLALPGRHINRLLTGAFSLERFILPRTALPFGLSLLCVARKPLSAPDTSRETRF